MNAHSFALFAAKHSHASTTEGDTEVYTVERSVLFARVSWGLEARGTAEDLRLRMHWEGASCQK
jgi:hypothetical protein